MFFRKKLFLFFVFIILLIPVFSFAEDSQDIKEEIQLIEGDLEDINMVSDNIQNENFKATVLEILEEKELINENGGIIKQQNLKLKILNGNNKGKEIIYNGIGDLQVELLNEFRVGDKVIMSYDYDVNGEIFYYILDYVRSFPIYVLIILFFLIVILLNGIRGLRAIISLFISFLVIIKFIIPQILKGNDPIFIGILGGIFILLLVVYITEGFNKKSHIAVLGIFISMIIVGVLSVIFSNMMKLTGLSEESMFLVSMINKTIDFRGLLFAGVIIGSLGVLDDMVISQISSVFEIKLANSNLSNKEVFKKAYKIGVSHVGSMTNTLFLAYAGSSLTVLLLFYVGSKGSFTQVINTDIIAIEIFRSFVGAIGICLSMPISTFLATYFLENKK